MTAPVPYGALTECEAVIERGLRTFVEVGEALLRIRDERLYRETHGTFEDYCRERWAMRREVADRAFCRGVFVRCARRGCPRPGLRNARCRYCQNPV